MDILFEILIELYMECMFLIIPEDKRNKKHYLIAKLVAILCTVGILALAVWGLVWLVDSKNLWGWLPLGIAIFLSVIQIVFGIVLFIRRSRKEKVE